MTISEYEVFGVVNWTDRLKAFTGQVRQELVVLQHSHGETIRPTNPLPRQMMIDWALREYSITGDKANLVKAAAWIVAEWAD